MRSIGRFLLVTLMLVTPTAAFAQSDEADSSSSMFWDITKSVVLDPTTYAPAVLSYSSMKLD